VPGGTRRLMCAMPVIILLGEVGYLWDTGLFLLENDGILLFRQ
jgi:hypothetical protein